MDNYQYYLAASRKVCMEIRNHCKAKKIHFSDLADQIGISQATVNRYIGPRALTGEDWTPPSLLFLLGAADVLGIDPAELLPNSPGRNPLRDSMIYFKRRMGQRGMTLFRN